MSRATRVNDLPASQRGVIRAWCMYDWANSGFFASGVAAIFPVYFVVLFRASLGEQASFFGLTFTGSSMWGLGAAISTAVVALSSPVLGVVADRIPIKKLLLSFYMAIGSLFTGLAFFSAYTPEPWIWVLFTFSVANIGAAGSLVFYNSFLPHLGPQTLLDDISSRGYAYGYVGGGLLLFIHLILIMATDGMAIADQVTRGSIASIGLWWFLWSLWTLKVVPEPPIQNIVRGLHPVRLTILAFRTLRQTIGEITKFKVIAIYLGAYLLFNDGIQTVMGIAGAFAADTLGIPLAFNMATILIIQFVAAPGAMGFSWLAGKFTTKTALTCSLVGWSFIVLFGVGMAPLKPINTGDFEYLVNYDEERTIYTVDAAPDLSNSFTGSLWSQEVPFARAGLSLRPDQAVDLVNSVRISDYSAYSVLVQGGPVDGQSSVGHLHPSSLGNGPIDWWPVMLRDLLWDPLEIGVGYQWLILGVGVGVVMGGSQALARSLFAQITPHSRSGEFFAFFGFMGRASSVFGPMLYVFFTGVFDTRVAVTSILVIIVAGTWALKWVDVPAGVRTATIVDGTQSRN